MKTQKLTIEHLALYLPYGLKGFSTYSGQRQISLSEYMMYWADEQGVDIDLIGYELFIPILRPLSDLAKEIEVNGERFVALEKIQHDAIYCISRNEFLRFLKNKTNEIEIALTAKDYNSLISWHFDIFNLIEQGLAVDINTIQK